MGGVILIFSRHPATCIGDLEGAGQQRIGSTAGFVSPRTLQSGGAPRRIQRGNGEEMTGNRHNHEGHSGDSGEPEPGPYWKRMHRDWRFWIGAILMGAAIAVYVLSGDLAWVPRGHPQPALPATGP